MLGGPFLVQRVCSLLALLQCAAISQPGLQLGAFSPYVLFLLQLLWLAWPPHYVTTAVEPPVVLLSHSFVVRLRLTTAPLLLFLLKLTFSRLSGRFEVCQPTPLWLAVFWWLSTAVVQQPVLSFELPLLAFGG